MPLSQASLVAVWENTPMRPGRAGSSPVIRLVLLALKMKAGMRLRRISLATVLYRPDWQRTGGRRVWACTVEGAGGGALQK